MATNEMKNRLRAIFRMAWSQFWLWNFRHGPPPPKRAGPLISYSLCMNLAKIVDGHYQRAEEMSLA